MKKINYLALFTFAALVLSSCGGLNKMQENASDVSYEVTPPILEERGDEVDVQVDVRYPEKYFNKKAILTLTPVLVYDGGETAYDSKTVQGEDVEANNQVISSDGGSISYSGTVPYSEDMMKSNLVMRVEAELKGKEMQFEDVKIGEGIIATSNLVMMDAKPIMVGDKFQRIIPESREADIHYIINRSNVRSSELRSEDIAEFEDYLKNADTNERIDLKEVNVSAYASPDGPYDFNKDLAEDRQGSAKRYLEREMRRSEISKAQEENFLTLSFTAEDWEGFKEKVQESNIPDKELILRVLSMYSDPQVREREIKNLSQAFEELKEDILPELRRSKMSINVDLIGHSDDELVSLWESNPDSLNLEELLYTANLYDDLDTKLEIYKKTAQNYPDCFRAKNNMGYVYVKQDKAQQAKDAFEDAKEIQDNDVVNNNLGVVALMEGNIDEAKQLFTSARGAGENVSYNLGIINIIQGDYEEAASNFGNIDDFNVALVELLRDDFNAAMSTINNVEDDFAKKYYLKAVIAANQDKDEMVMENLRMAIERDDSLKDRAANDMEFAEYFENETFQGLVD